MIVPSAMVFKLKYDAADLIVYVEYKHRSCESRNVPREVVLI